MKQYHTNMAILEEMPEIGQDQINKACYLLILGLLSTGAGEMKLEQKKFHDREGNILGDFQIIVKKIK